MINRGQRPISSAVRRRLSSAADGSRRPPKSRRPPTSSMRPSCLHQHPATHDPAAPIADPASASGSHRDPSRSRSPCPPAAVQAATKNPTSDPWQPEKKPKISSHFTICPRATNPDHTGQSSVARPPAKWGMAARPQQRHRAQISMDSEVGQRSSAIHRVMTSMENQAAPIIVD
ncbi:hypothetical protein ACLOJK_038937 [Asimina triloba]